MSSSFSRFRILTLFAGVLALGSGGWADDGALAGDSPFLPPAGAASQAGTPTPDTPIELRGIMESPSGTMFSIFDPSHRTSTWVKLNEAGRDFIVRRYDERAESVVVDFQGRSVTLALRTAKVGSAPGGNTVASNGPPPPPIGGPVVLNPTPADEQRRLEAIAAEVNRRRQLRQQALRQQQQQRPPQQK